MFFLQDEVLLHFALTVCMFLKKEVSQDHEAIEVTRPHTPQFLPLGPCEVSCLSQREEFQEGLWWYGHMQ